MVMSDPREMLLGGEVRVLPQPKHPEYGHFVLSPRETRALSASAAGRGSSPSKPAIRCTAPTNMPWSPAWSG